MANSPSKNGINFFGYLGLIFITLKLMGYIQWSWWYVLLPLYGGIAIVLIIFLIAWLIELLVK